MKEQGYSTQTTKERADFIISILRTYFMKELIKGKIDYYYIFKPQYLDNPYYIYISFKSMKLSEKFDNIVSELNKNREKENKPCC